MKFKKIPKEKEQDRLYYFPKKQTKVNKKTHLMKELDKLINDEIDEIVLNKEEK